MPNYFIFNVICLLIFWAFYQVFLKKDTFFERNRYYLLLTASIACLTPLLEVSVSQEDIQATGLEDFVLLPALEISGGLVKQFTYENTDATKSVIIIYHIVKLIYFIGVAITLILFLLRIRKLFVLIKRCQCEKSQPIVASKKIKVIPNETASTFSFFNYLFWDSSLNLSQKEEQQILLHELAHINGKHSYDLVFIELYKIVFWFNPLVYLYQKEIINQHEFIADSKALTLSNTESYISLMVSSLFKSLQIDFTHSFHNQQIKQRIKMLHTEKTSWIKGNAKTILAVALVVVVAGAVACSNALTSIEKDQQLSEMKIAQAQNKEALLLDYLKEMGLILKKYPNSRIVNESNQDLTKVSDIDLKKSLLNVDKIRVENVDNEKDRQRIVFLFFETRSYMQAELNQKLGSKEIKIDANGIYTLTEKTASPVGGMPEMYKLMASEMRYPQEAREKGLEGKVYVQFVVNTDGSLTDMEVIKGVENSPKLDEIVVVSNPDKSVQEKQVIKEGLVNSLHTEAMRVIALTKWKAGEQEGKKVRQRIVMPIVFKLD